MDQFYWTSNKRVHRGRTCKKCNADAQRKRVFEKKDEVRIAARRFSLRANYGLTLEEWEKLRENQAGNCAICCLPLKDGKTHVDHEHKTGSVRGLLCFSCNVGLGKFRDSSELLRRAANYLDSPKPIITEVARKMNPEEKRTGRSNAAKRQHSSERGREMLAIRRRLYSGENNLSSKLSDKDVLEVRRIYAEGKLSQSDIAEAFGVSQGAVSRCVLGKRTMFYAEGVA